MVNLKAKELSLGQVHSLLGFVPLPRGTFASLLLEPLTEFEAQELKLIQDDFNSYLTEGRVLEGLVQALTTYPLLRLAGFYRAPIQLSIEQNIADIAIEDEDTIITARLDILAFNKTRQLEANQFFWVLIIESKNSAPAPAAGLPQLLTYAYKSLEQQDAVWGLVTNGELHQFVYIQRGNPPTYQLMPTLNLLEAQAGSQLLQVLKAIRSNA
jgi:hypothetical protein